MKATSLIHKLLFARSSQLQFGQLSKNQLIANAQRNFSKKQKNAVDLLNTRPEKAPAIAPMIKQQIKTRFPEFDDKTPMNLNDPTFAPTLAPNEYLKHMDTSFESFFYQRDYTKGIDFYNYQIYTIYNNILQKGNFNFYLQVLSQQYKPEQALDAFRKMETMGIQPDDESYNHLMTAYARMKDVEMVEKLNKEAVFKYKLPPSAQRQTQCNVYNAIILALAKSNNAQDAEKVLNEMKREGLKPDCVSYTTVIDAYKRQRNLDKCWELFDLYHTIDKGRGADEFLMSYMIRLCAGSHDAEKAIRLFNQLEGTGFIKHAIPYNSIIFALASTYRYAEQLKSNQYAEKALEYWHKMHVENIQPDRHTFVAILKACSQLGDTKTAYDILQEMKQKGFPMTEYVYNELIRVYANACREPDIKESHIDMYIKDCWELMDNMKKDNVEPNIHILNSLVHVYANSLKTPELENKVLPLYEKYKIKHDLFNQLIYQYN